MTCNNLDGLSKYFDFYSSYYERIVLLDDFDVCSDENH